MPSRTIEAILTESLLPYEPTWHLRGGRNMNILTLLIMALAFFLVVFLGLVKVSGDLWLSSTHESPTILDTHGEPPRAEEPPASAGRRDSSPRQLSVTQ
jgi:hypothetical protein